MHTALKLKSWQLFLLFLGIAGLAHLLLNPLLPEENRHFLLLSPFEIALLLLLLSWFWILGIWLNRLVLEELRSGTIIFTLSIILSIAIVICLQTLFILQPASSSLLDLIPLIAPLYFLFIFCMLYNLYFIAKNLVLAEKNATVKPEEYIVPFLALWFFPIGLWLLQPRVNALYTRKIE